MSRTSRPDWTASRHLPPRQRDREYAAKIDEQVDARMDKYMKLADEVFDKVYGRFC